MAGERFSMLLIGSFGLLAVFLAAVGVYGVISYSVARRTREISIRVALGAQRGHIFGMIIRHAIGFAGLGIFIGVIVTLVMGKILTGFLYEVSACGPANLYVRVCLPRCNCAVSQLPPARRAAAVYPLEALRID